MASDKVIETFNRILNKNSIDETKVIITGLKSSVGNNNFRASYRRYTEIATKLPTAKVTQKTADVSEIKIGADTDEIKIIGGGTYGTIFLGTSGNVYKRISLRAFDGIGSIEKHHERFHRELFIEAYIQCVLQCDDGYGSNIARLDGIYKDKSVEDTSTLGLSQQTHTYYFKMENIAYTLKKYLETLPDEDTIKEKISASFQTLGEMLGEFGYKYKFFHRDLHQGNIMFTEAGEIKLIDFGLSCMVVDDEQYSVETDECFSYDLFILICSIMEFGRIPSLLKEFNELMSDGKNNIYDIMYSATPLNEAIFHRAYYGLYMEPRQPPWDNHKIRVNFYNNIGPKFQPDKFSEFWKDYHNTLIASKPKAPAAVTAPAVTVPSVKKSLSKTKGGKKTRRSLRKRNTRRFS